MEKKLPVMKDWSDQRIARFWESHSVAEFIDELEEVTDVKFVPPKTAVAIRLEAADLEEVKEIAKEMGIGHTVLIRMWIKEKLKRAKVA